jgi:hypothetical protein
MPAVQSAMAEAQAHGATRRVDADCAYSKSGYACAVIAFEFPGTSIDDVQPIIVVCTKMLDDGRAATNIFGGVYGKTVVNGIEVPQFRDDVPGAFQIAVSWTDQTALNQQPPGSLAVADLFDDFAVWWETTQENQRYWAHAIVEDRSVATSLINQTLINAGNGALAGALGGLLGGGPGAAVVGGGIGGMVGAFATVQTFLNQPRPKNIVRPAPPLEKAAGATAFGPRRPSWGQLKATYR